MSDQVISSKPDTSSQKMWIAGGIFFVVAVVLLLHFFVFKKSSKSEQPQPPSMQLQSPQPPSMKMKMGRRGEVDNLPIGTMVHCESDKDCPGGNGCGLVTGDSNKQCCRYGTYNNHFGTMCSNKYCTSDSDCPNGCGLVIGDSKQQCCPNYVLRTSSGPDPFMDPLDPEMGSSDSLNICV